MSTHLHAMWAVVLAWLWAGGWRATALQVVDGPSINTFDKTISIKNEAAAPASADARQGPHPVSGNSWSDPSALIFVGISHYRDQRCSTTLQSLFSQAAHPERLRVGIVQQIHTEADPFHCLEDFCKASPQFCKHRDEQFRLLEITHQLARGPNFARSLQNTLIKDEEFCMQVDSHSSFAQDWDVKATTMFGKVNNEFAILSTQPPDVSSALKPTRVVPHLCQATFKDGQVINLPPAEAVNLETPLLAPLYSAAFSFSKCHAERKVPNDPDLQMIFEMDEFAKFARLWTHGYDVYTPNEPIVFHDYAGSMELLPGTMKRTDALGRVVNTNPNHNVNSPMEWLTRGRNNIYRRQLYDNSLKRLSLLLGLDQAVSSPTDLMALTHYGLGPKRSLAKLMSFTGIDLKRKRIAGDRCLELHWVPYEFDHDEHMSSGDAWGLGPERAIKGARNVPLLSSRPVNIVSVQDYSNWSPVTAVDSENQDAAGSVSAGEIPPSALVQEEIPVGVDTAAAVADTPASAGEHVHYGGELWWIFQIIDTAVEDIINAAEMRMGYTGFAHKAMKVVLVLLPAFCLIVALAFWLVLGGSFSSPQAAKLFHSGLKRI